MTDFWIREGLSHITPKNKEFPEGFDVLNYLNRFIGDSVVEVGCGYGRLSPAFKNYIGYDINPSAISLAKRRFPDKDFRLMDGPVKGGVVLLYTVLLHIPDLKEFLSNIHSDYLCICEIMGREWRREGDPPVFNRDVEEYESLGKVIKKEEVPYLHYRNTNITFLMVKP